MRTTATLPWDALGPGPWAAPSIAAVDRLPAECDVAIIGGGITGLATAWRLAGSGREVVVVDRHFGHGATSRSGGIIVGDTLAGPASGFDRCEHDLRAWILGEDAQATGRQAEIDLIWNGVWELDRDATLSTTPVDWADVGSVRVSSTVDGGTLDPAALLSALAAAAAARGVVLVDRVTVDGYDAGPGPGVIVRAGSEQLRSRQVLVATDATGHAASQTWWPEVALTVALQTEPLTAEQADAIGWNGRRPFYTNELPLLWGRTLPGDTLLLGRELISVVPDPVQLRQSIRDAGDRLTIRLRGLHPALQTVQTHSVWAGPIARDESGVPSVQQDKQVPGVYWAGGYGGHGIAQAFRLSARAAGVLA